MLSSSGMTLRILILRISSISEMSNMSPGTRVGTHAVDNQPRIESSAASSRPNDPVTGASRTAETSGCYYNRFFGTGDRA